MIRSFLTKRFNYVVIAFLAMTIFGVYMTFHVTAVNHQQTADIEDFVQSHKALHCIDGLLEFWQFDPVTDRYVNYQLTVGNENMRCLMLTPPEGQLLKK